MSSDEPDGFVAVAAVVAAIAVVAVAPVAAVVDVVAVGGSGGSCDGIGVLSNCIGDCACVKACRREDSKQRKRGVL